MASRMTLCPECRTIRKAGTFCPLCGTKVVPPEERRPIAPPARPQEG
jgi:uncharacterized Zn finger protein (UPF0148 family)